MPTTKKESLQFGLMMCLGMVVAMTTYNLVINGMIGEIPILSLIFQYITGFAVAIVLEIFIVGPAAGRMASKLPYDKSNKFISIVSMSLCMVAGMVLLMSLYGLITAYFTGHLTGGSWMQSYGSIAFKNFIFALPLQLLIMGPLVRFLFGRFVKGKEMAGSAV
ncbi:hypothetical protein ACQCVH_14440 [Bacillus infantis]|uniref:hypothetical protein n=1 Tax=Bacillus infantis TaxID=324767 RepID=UPI003CEDF8CD